MWTTSLAVLLTCSGVCSFTVMTSEHAKGIGVGDGRLTGAPTYEVDTRKLSSIITNNIVWFLSCGLVGIALLVAALAIVQEDTSSAYHILKLPAILTIPILFLAMDDALSKI